MVMRYLNAYESFFNQENWDKLMIELKSVLQKEADLISQIEAKKSIQDAILTIRFNKDKAIKEAEGKPEPLISWKNHIYK